jgi:hypothetical protein
VYRLFVAKMYRRFAAGVYTICTELVKLRSHSQCLNTVPEKAVSWFDSTSCSTDLQIMIWTKAAAG